MKKVRDTALCASKRDPVIKSKADFVQTSDKEENRQKIPKPLNIKTYVLV